MKTIDVAAGVIFSSGKILITQRCKGQHLENLWEFPGGKVEDGESFEACLHREIREELGIEISIGELIEDLAHDYPEKRVRLKFFRCNLVSGQPKAIHCQDWRWVTPPELKHFEFPAADARLIELLIAQSFR